MIVIFNLFMEGVINLNSVSKIGVSTVRKEAWDKVTGAAKYNGDMDTANTLHAKLLTSPHSHATIISIDTSKAYKSPGVQAIITGDIIDNMLTGSVIGDRPFLAKDKVRYFGEPVALVVANSEAEAKRAVHLIEVEYEQLPVVNSIDKAISLDATLVHENLGQYTKAVDDVYPEPGSNICDHVKIRKGNIDYGFNTSDIILESEFLLPQSDHLAMETRNAKVEILPNGDVIVYTSSQAPYSIRKKFSKYFSIPGGKIIVRVPLVGGAFGGKATVQLEYLAYLASKVVGGKLVKLVNSREEDIATSPCKVGTKAKLIIGATSDGMIKALKATYYVDCGAYADTGPRMSKAMIVDSTGPYNIPYVWCDSYSIYTNHNYVTSFRGFGHAGFTFCIERMMEKLATHLNLDSLELRLKNCVQPGDTSPTLVPLTRSNMGNIDKCIAGLKDLINWNDSDNKKKVQDNGMIRAKGISPFWKTSDSPTNASSGAILTFNSDGSLNINFGGVEIGPGMKTTMCQILAEKMKMDIDKINVFMHVDTQISPEHWKTVASSTTFMVGNAVIDAANSLIKDLCEIGSVVLKCPANDLEVGYEKVYMRDNPSINVGFTDIVHGYEYTDGNSIGGQIMATGSYIMKHLTPLDKETGKGVPGVSWTVGAQAVEIEYDPIMHTYRLLKAATVIDAGKVINPKTAKGLIMGGMSMGLGIATREEFIYDELGIIENTSLRTYKLMRFGEQPEYLVDFVETPQIDGPFGARGIAEHGVIGIPAAFANAISKATGEEIDQLPILPELIWKIKGGN